VLFRLGKQLFNERSGLLAAFIFTLYPAAIHFSVQKIGYVMLLVLLALLLIQKTIQLSTQPCMVRSLVLGGLSGVASLVNPVIVAFYPFGLLWFVWRCQSFWPSRLKYAVAIIMCCAATMTPWLIRNYLVFNRFMFLKSNFTVELMHAAYYKDAGPSGLERPPALITDEGQMIAFYNQKALSLILQEPARLLRKITKRAISYWLRMESPRSRDLLAGIAYYPVLFLGLAGVWAVRRNQQAQLLIVFLLTMPLPFYLTWAVLVRYRFPIEPILMLFASYAVISWFTSTLSHVVKSPKSP